MSKKTSDSTDSSSTWRVTHTDSHGLKDAVAGIFSLGFTTLLGPSTPTHTLENTTTGETRQITASLEEVGQRVKEGRFD